MKCKKFLKAQVWVETAVYTIIGLAIIGIILAIANPSIQRYKDNAVIEQTISALTEFNSEIIDVRDKGVGNRRVRDFSIQKGSLTIDSQIDKIFYILEESKVEYSEIGKNITLGDLEIRTEENGRKFNIILTLNYDNIDITCNKKDDLKVFNQAPNPYKLYIENNGTINDKIQVDIGEI